MNVVGYLSYEIGESLPNVTPCWLTTLSGHQVFLINRTYLPPFPLYWDFLALKTKELRALETTVTATQRDSIISQKPGVLGGIAH